jgi:hypothetical protein
MIIKRVICGFGLILGVLHAVPAFAEISLAYEHYLSEGIKAFEQRDDEKAISDLKRAHLINPSAKEPGVYLMMIQARQPAVEHGASYGATVTTADVQDYGHAVVAALDQYELDSTQVPETKAVTSFLKPTGVAASRKVAASPNRMKVITETLDRMTRVVASGVAPGQVSMATLAPFKEKKAPDIISLVEQMRQGDTKPRLQLELGASVILEGRNIQRFLVVDEGFLQAKTIGQDQIQVTAKKIGRTFLHIWDDNGRWTFQVEDVFPRSEGLEAVSPRSALLEHSRPFQFKYSNDWSAYYYDAKDTGLVRRSVNYRQDLGVVGDTPYGVLDASSSMAGLGRRLVYPYYTLGLSDIPVPGTQELNLRVFDTSRSLSPLTLPGAYLRGVFADVKLFQSAVALSLSHGREQSAYGYFSTGYSTAARNSYVNAYRLILFPDSQKDRFVLNYAQGYGSGRQASLTKEAYSIEGEHRFEKAAIKAELARDNKHTASLAGWKWNSPWLATAINFRNINKDFTTVIAAPSNQGEIGALWTASVNTQQFSADTTVDVYQDRLFFNPDDRSAYNYDTSAHVRKPINKVTWSDTNIRYVDTPQEISPRRFTSLDTRLTRDFEVWNSRRGSVYAGGAYQKSTVTNSSISDYDRYAMVLGARIPLTKDLSSYASYEYSWLHEPQSGQDSSPNVFNAGLAYNKNITEKVSGNASLNYRKEQDVRGTNSFLSGEDSLGVNAGLRYNPNSDVSYFVDGQARKAWSLKAENPSYNDLDIRFGMRIAWGVPLRWDPHGVVSGIVFKDLNRNGKFDRGESGLPDITVKVGDKETATDRDGRYSVNVRAKRVLVAPALESLPPGYMFSKSGFTKVEVLQGRTRKVDFGLTTHTGIYGIVYVDQNGNGTPDHGDQFVQGVKLVLDGISTLSTDGQGVYFFDEVSPGKHALKVDIMSVPIKLIPLIKLQNDFSVSEGTNYVFHVPLKAKEQKVDAGL